MPTPTIALLSPGEMGHAVGRVLHDHGLRVLTCLAGRSDRSHALAQAAGLEDTPDLTTLVQEADILLSILFPAQATALADQIAETIRATNADLLYVDCNAVAPRTAQSIAATISAAGARVADVGIVGPPPTKPGTRFYTSGPGAPEFAQLTDFGLDVRLLDGDIGQASGFKMCYGALTKGLQALGTELLLAASRLGIADALRAEQQDSMPDVLAYLEGSLPSMPPKAHRWIGEMEEIAACFADLDLTPRILLGAADLYRLVAASPLGHEKPETRDPSRTLDGVIDALAAPITPLPTT